MEVTLEVHTEKLRDISFNYSGASILVTGGTHGIGRGIATAYREAGAEVIVTGTRPQASDYEADLSDFQYFQLELTDNSQIETLANAIPRLDILINNAGRNLEHSDEYAIDVFERAVRINLLGIYRLTHACYPKLLRSAFPTGPSVISLASLTTFFGMPEIPAYGASKAGIAQLVKSLAIRWAADGIRVNAVAPGVVLSGLTVELFDSKETTEALFKRQPIQRIGLPEDVAGAVLFLTSSAASFITGQTLLVDGGYSVVG